MKDYRGKNAEQEIWKADVGLESSIRDDLKQIAIEEGQWGEKREPNGREVVPVTINVVFVEPPPRDEAGNLIVDVNKG